MAHSVKRLTPGGRPYQVIGTQREGIFDITITSYTAGGEVISPRELGYGIIESAETNLQVGQATGTAVATVWDDAGSRIKCILPTGVDATVPAGSVIRLTVRGR